MTFLQKTLVLILLINIPDPVFAQQNCKAKFTDPYTATLKMGDQTVNFIGWLHPRDEQLSYFSKNSKEVRALAAQGACSLAQKKLQELLTKMAEDVAAAEDVYKRLDKLYKQEFFGKIGVERSYLAQLQNNHIDEDWTVKYSVVLQQCPGLKHSVDKLLTTMPSPADAFIRDKNGLVKVEGIESHYLRKQSFKGISEDVVYFFGGGPGISELTPEARTRVMKMKQDALVDLIPMSHEDIQVAVDAESNPKLKTKLLSGLKGIRNILTLARRRNKMIANNVVNRGGNYTIVLGSAHTKDLASVFEEKCLEMLSKPKENRKYSEPIPWEVEQ